MKRTNINNCKRVGNKIDNIIGQCEGSGIAVSYDCVINSGTNTCSSMTDSGQTSFGAFRDWYIANQPSTPIRSWKFAFTGQGTSKTPCLDPNGEPYYFFNAVIIYRDGAAYSPNFSGPPNQSWNDLINWVIADGCTSVTLGMDFAQVSAELLVCMDESTYIAINANPCQCSSTGSSTYICLDPGDGSGDYSTIAECTDSGCEFGPGAIEGMTLWLHASEDDVLIAFGGPYISKWKDHRWPNPALEFGALGLGDDTYPSWNGLNNGWVTFDGADFMQTADTINLDTETDLGWCIAVTTYMEDWNNTEVIIGDKDSNNNLIKFDSETAVHLKLYNPTLATSSTKGVTINNPAVLAQGTPYVFIINMNPTTNDAALWINGEKQTDGFTFPDGYDFHELDEIGAKNGGQLGMSGGIHEIIVYKGELTDTEIEQLTFYMHAQI